MCYILVVLYVLLNLKVFAKNSTDECRLIKLGRVFKCASRFSNKNSYNKSNLLSRNYHENHN